MKELAISIRNYNRDNYIEIIDNIKESGFKNVFIEWYNKDYDLQQNILKYVKDSDLNIIFAHLGYQNASDIWKDDVKGDIETERYIEDIKVCSKNDINLVIIHTTKNYEDYGFNEIGINRIRKILDCAIENKVKIAFENVELKGYLEYIVNNIQNENLGICFDVGHCHLFYDGKFNTELFKNKVFAIHLHDNYKQKDDHNLPFDGSVNWEDTIKKIIAMNYDGYIIIESGYNEFYKDINLETYYKKAYEVGNKLIELFNEWSFNNE